MSLCFIADYSELDTSLRGLYYNHLSAELSKESQDSEKFIPTLHVLVLCFFVICGFFLK